MCAVLEFALATHTGTTHLRESVDVDSLYAKSLFQFLPHAFCPRLSAKEADFQLKVFLLHAFAFLYHLCKVQGV